MTELDFSGTAAAFDGARGFGTAAVNAKDCFASEQSYTTAKAELADPQYAHAVPDGDAANICDDNRRWQTACKRWRRANDTLGEKDLKVQNELDGRTGCFSKAYQLLWP
jgi:hypothetical protein